MNDIISSSKKKIHDALMHQWYKQPTWIWVLMPLSLCMYVVVFLRMLLAKPKTINDHVPLIVVSNLTVGGGGKTPMTHWLVRRLCALGYKPAIISKGYGRIYKHPKPLAVSDAHSADEVGDEALLSWKRLQVPVIIGEERIKCLEYAKTYDIDIVICDDGGQDPHMQYDWTIMVMKKGLGLGNGWLLPVGPLRQPKSALALADVVVETGGMDHPNPRPVLHYELGDLKPMKKTFLKPMPGEVIQVITGIAYPQSLAKALQAKGYQVSLHPLIDHHRFSPDDFIQFSKNDIIVMSEKDAIKCGDFADHRFFVAPLTCKANAVLEQWVSQHFKQR